MAYVERYDWDVFVSYARPDNEPLIPSNKDSRWVSTFYQELETYLNRELPQARAARIFLDDRNLQGNEPLTPAISAALGSTAVLLAVISKRYLTSDWCRRERELFLGSQRAPTVQGRVFVVLRDKFPLEAWQPHYAPLSREAELLGYAFFEEDKQTGEVRVLGEPILQGDDKPYFAGLQRLCRQLAKKLDALKLSVAKPSLTNGEAVFLAETTPDLNDERERLKSFLEQSNFRVVPVAPYRRDPSEFRRGVDADLPGALAFIQILGRYASPPTPELPGGYEGLQAECAQRAGVPVFRWHRRDLEVETITNAVYRQLLTGPEVRITDGLEEFKQQLLTELRRLQAKRGVTTVAAAGEEYVAVAAPRQDAGPVAERLSQLQLSYDVLPDDFPLTDAAKGEEYDALLVFYHSATPEWVRDRVRQCRQIVLSRKEAPPLCGVLVDPPPPPRVLLTQPPGFRVISGARADQFQSFLDEVRQRRRSPTK